MKPTTRAGAIPTSLSAALSVDEAAEYLRISRATLYRLFREKKLIPARLGGRTLVRRIDADAFLESCVGAA
ncbi:helix-turn-helix domain-containing protein [Mesorhizobium sp. M0296]|uniref:helix-turn-helix domain-containing protein n=1 Tax=Mesorhizobium sp. M0296 TaxID=2956931 RepID=UPI00333B72E7